MPRRRDWHLLSPEAQQQAWQAGQEAMEEGFGPMEVAAAVLLSGAGTLDVGVNEMLYVGLKGLRAGGWAGKDDTDQWRLRRPAATPGADDPVQQAMPTLLPPQQNTKIICPARTTSSRDARHAALDLEPGRPA